MKAIGGRPVIEATDSPLLIDQALHNSTRLLHEQLPPQQASMWPKTAADAWGALQDGFGIIGGHVYRPQGEAELFMSPDQLELALVAHGCELLDNPQDQNVQPEILAIDGLLDQIDHIKAAR